MNSKCIGLVLGGLLVTPTRSYAHDKSETPSETSAVKLGAAGGIAVQSIWLSTGEPTGNIGLGPSIQLSVGTAAGKTIFTRVSWAATFLLPAAPWSVNGVALGTPAYLESALLWSTDFYFGEGSSRAGLRGAIGPALGHVFESTGDVVENTLFGAHEELGFVYQFSENGRVRPEFVVSFVSSQLAAGRDAPGITSGLTFGGTVNFGLTWDPIY